MHPAFSFLLFAADGDKIGRRDLNGMDIKELRSQLCHAIAELSSSLTDGDLTELKWPTVKRIFALLIEHHTGSELWDQRNALTTLLHERNLVLSSRRNGTARNHTKEQRSDEDSTFRTMFYRIVLDALTILRWPPAMEVFSDPLGALHDDNVTIISAITHLLQRGGRRQNDARTKSATMYGTPPAEKNIPANEGRSSERKRTMINFDDSASIVPSPPELTPLDKVRDEVAAFSPTVDCSSRSDSNPPVESLRYSLNLAHHQNEVLSKSLKQIQEAVCIRENAESRMSIILGELKTTVDEIVGLGNGKRPAYRQSDARAGAAAVKGGKIDNNSTILTGELELEFRREVEREEKDEHDRRRDKEGAQIGLTSNAPNSSSLAKSAVGNKHRSDDNSVVAPAHATASSSESSILWTRLHGRIGTLHQQWEEARGDARRAVVQVAEVLPPHDLGNGYLYVKTRSPGGDERTSSGSRMGSNGTNAMSLSRRLRLHQVRIMPRITTHLFLIPPFVF